MKSFGHIMRKSPDRDLLFQQRKYAAGFGKTVPSDTRIAQQLFLHFSPNPPDSSTRRGR